MRYGFALILVGWCCVAVTLAQSPRFVIDDDEYLDKLAAGSARLVREGKLIPLATLQKQVHTKGSATTFLPPAQTRMTPQDLCDRLRESVFAVGTYYKCSECPEWHVNTSGGFVVTGDGLICTCCHVVTAEDEGVTEAYMIAADAKGHVYPVQEVVAADTEADTCFLRIGASGLKPLPFRPNARAGERVYCLSHPGGYHFMFTEGMVARVNRRRDEVMDEHGHTNGVISRPILYLNVTAEFAPGSSGAPLVDEAGNVLGQVSSIADAGEPGAGNDHTAASPSVPVRFCVAAEEILHLSALRTEPNARTDKKKSKVETRKSR